MNNPWQALPAALALAIPLTYGVGALAVSSRSLRHAVRITTGSFALAVLVLLTSAVHLRFGSLAELTRSAAELRVRLDVLTLVMLLLVTGLAVVIARYSRSYLRGDANRGRYARWLLATLSAVSALVVANNLLHLAIAWLCAGGGLYQLLTLYRERTNASIAAHKKFLVSRLGDLAVFTALGLIASNVGSVELDKLEAWLSSRNELPHALQLAAGLLVAAVALKSAQLPFHGWLTQVMEAPTPVSALLHAGVVNIGGFVMIRLCSLMALAPAAQFALVAVGTFTTVFAALAMSTRVSVKAGLAWSTCAQMGFMLLQCGLGLWHLALLHLVAHSLYKAHAFLSAGGVVDAYRSGLLARPARPLSWSTAALAVGLSSALALLCCAAANAILPGRSLHHLDLFSTLLIALSLAPPLMQVLGHESSVRWANARSYALMGALFFLWHESALFLAPVSRPFAASVWSIVVVVLGLGALFACQLLIQLAPKGRFAARVYALSFTGLYCDALFTRTAFRVWPPRFPSAAKNAEQPAAPQILEA